MERDDILKTIRELRPWYHNIHLGHGIWTKDLTDPENLSPGMNVPRPLWKAIAGIDSDQGAAQSFIKQAEFCKRILGLDVDFRPQELLDLPESLQFDLILFLGVFYHVPNFCDALEKIRRLCKPGGIVAVESQVASRSLTCYEGKGFRGDPTTFFVPSIGVLTALLTEYGFAIERSFPLREGRYFCLCN